MLLQTASASSVNFATANPVYSNEKCGGILIETNEDIYGIDAKLRSDMGPWDSGHVSLYEWSGSTGTELDRVNDIHSSGATADLDATLSAGNKYAVVFKSDSRGITGNGQSYPVTSSDFDAIAGLNDYYCNYGKMSDANFFFQSMSSDTTPPTLYVKNGNVVKNPTGVSTYFGSDKDLTAINATFSGPMSSKSLSRSDFTELNVSDGYKYEIDSSKWFDPGQDGTYTLTVHSVTDSQDVQKTPEKSYSTDISYTASKQASLNDFYVENNSGTLRAVINTDTSDLTEATVEVLSPENLTVGTVNISGHYQGEHYATITESPDQKFYRLRLTDIWLNDIKTETDTETTLDLRPEDTSSENQTVKPYVFNLEIRSDFDHWESASKDMAFYSDSLEATGNKSYYEILKVGIEEHGLLNVSANGSGSASITVFDNGTLVNSENFEFTSQTSHNVTLQSGQTRVKLMPDKGTEISSVSYRGTLLQAPAAGGGSEDSGLPVNPTVLRIILGGLTAGALAVSGQLT